MHHILLFIVAGLLTWVAKAVNFLYETDQLTQSDIDKFPAIQFGDASLEQHKSECRAFPGSEDWPNETDWNSFNESLGGVLLNEKPPAAACYQGPTFNAEKCSFWSMVRAVPDFSLIIRLQHSRSGPPAIHGRRWGAHYFIFQNVLSLPESLLKEQWLTSPLPSVLRPQTRKASVPKEAFPPMSSMSRL